MRARPPRSPGTAAYGDLREDEAMGFSRRGGPVALAMVVALGGCGGSDDPGGTESAGATVERSGPVTELERTVQRAARRYVRAMREGDLVTLCAGSSASERRRPGGICDLQTVGRLSGPTPKVGRPTVSGSQAEVRVARGVDATLVLDLVLEGGRWYVDVATLESEG